MFQSTPVIADGRIVLMMLPVPSNAGFNPRPSLLTGESVGQRIYPDAIEVSIHARHC